MTQRPVPSALRAVLEYGPIVAFLVAYFLLRNESYTVGGTVYSGFVAVTAAFMPIFVASTLALWALTGALLRLQIAVMVLLVLFGGVGVWLNDPGVIKMKPTAIYLTLGVILAVGILRGQSWLSYVLGDLIPLKKRGWRILTRRVTGFCFAAALANEVVWRTQSESFWVVFETIAMPLVVLAFCLSQIPLAVEHTAIGGTGKRRRASVREKL